MAIETSTTVSRIWKFYWANTFLCIVIFFLLHRVWNSLHAQPVVHKRFLGLSPFDWSFVIYGVAAQIALNAQFRKEIGRLRAGVPSSNTFIGSSDLIKQGHKPFGGMKQIFAGSWLVIVLELIIWRAALTMNLK